MSAEKKTVTLRFLDIRGMLDYMTILGLEDCESDRSNALLSCELTEAEIELALNGYSAEMVG